MGSFLYFPIYSLYTLLLVIAVSQKDSDQTYIPKKEEKIRKNDKLKELKFYSRKDRPQIAYEKISTSVRIPFS